MFACLNSHAKFKMVVILKRQCGAHWLIDLSKILRPNKRSPVKNGATLNNILGSFFLQTSIE